VNGDPATIVLGASMAIMRAVVREKREARAVVVRDEKRILMFS